MRDGTTIIFTTITTIYVLSRHYDRRKITPDLYSNCIAPSVLVLYIGIPKLTKLLIFRGIFLYIDMNQSKMLRIVDLKWFHMLCRRIENYWSLTCNANL